MRRTQNVLDNWVLVPLLVNQFGFHYFRFVIWRELCTWFIILQLYRTLLEISFGIAYPSSYLFWFCIMVAVKHGGYLSDLVTRFCLFTCFVSLGKMVTLSDESLIAHVKEEEDNSYHGGWLPGKHLAQFTALSKCIIKGSFFLYFKGMAEFWGSYRSFGKKPDEHIYSFRSPCCWSSYSV